MISRDDKERLFSMLAATHDVQRWIASQLVSDRGIISRDRRADIRRAGNRIISLADELA